MKPIDFALENWESIRSRVDGDREAVWKAWLQHGPGTTEDVATRAGWDWRRFRPRTTELLQAGFVALVERDRVKKAGVYRGCAEAEALQSFRNTQSRMRNPQLSLALKA
jgi:hypothetical protein